MARQFADQALENEPRRHAARLALARVLVAERQFERARSELKLLVDAAPEVAEVHVLQGELEYAESHIAAARRAFERAIVLDAESTDALAGLVRLDLSAQRPDEAKRRAEARLATSPGDTALLLLTARTAAAAGDFSRAESILQTAIQVDANALEAYRLLGQIYFQQNRIEEARAQYERVARQTDAVSAHTVVAIMLYVQGRQDEARRRYEDIVRKDPTAAVAANNLAYIYADDGVLLDRAMELARTAEALLPGDADVSDTLGWVYYKRNVPLLAIEHLERSVQKDPANPVSRYHLGLAFLQSGDRTRAGGELREALRIDDRFAYAHDARRVLLAMSP